MQGLCLWSALYPQCLAHGRLSVFLFFNSNIHFLKPHCVQYSQAVTFPQHVHSKVLGKNLKRKMGWLFLGICLWILILWHIQLNEVIVLRQTARKEIQAGVTWILTTHILTETSQEPQARGHQANENRIPKFKKQITRRLYNSWHAKITLIKITLVKQQTH